MATTRSAAQSRFGLRMIALFAICSLLPILIFSAFAYQHTREQLEAGAVAALRRAAKDLSVRSIDRLARAADELEHAIAHDLVELDEGVRFFDSIAPWPDARARLKPEEWAALEAGRTLLVIDPADPRHRLRLVRRGPGEAVTAGVFSGAALLPSDEIEFDRHYWLSTADGTRIFPVLDAPPAGPPLPLRTRLELEGPDGPEIAMVWPVFLRGHMESEGLRVGIAIDREIVLEPLAAFESAFLAVIALGLLGSIALALHQVRHRIGPLEELIRVARAVEAGDYAARASIASGDEFDELGRSFNAMTAEVAQHVDHLRQLTVAGGRMLAEPTVDAVAEHLTDEVLGLTSAELAVLFRAAPGDATREARAVEARVARRGPVAKTALVDLHFACPELHEGAPLLLEREPDRAENLALWSGCERLVGESIAGMLVLPLRTGPGPIRTFLALATLRAGSEGPWLGRSFNALRILGDQGGVAIQVAELVSNLRALFEGVIHLTVQAIDEKSPYTGDHCRRVPVLTEQIADAVDRAEQGPLKDFRLTSAERYELRIAALLHDCGKVATPVHVMDKATKLETIMDRIEVVRSRAEILRRDFEIAALRQAVGEAGIADPTGADAHRALVERLDEDFAFLEKCNLGGEFMDPGAKSRVDEIAARYAWRDRAGAAHGLVDDTDLENLKIGRGTLNASERGVIEGHASTTIRLLERLPFPPEMARVPYIAGAHHERLDGTGYPNGLAAADLNIQARILGVADVFEALTAKDRPYKAGRTLSQTLRILESMVADRHIDGEILDVMLKQKVHLKYALEYMDPEQIDGVHREELEAMTAPWDQEAAPN